jgi:hypothetical protein
MASDVTVAPTLGHAVLMTQGGVGSSPGYDAIDLRRMIQAASGFQEGVYDSTGWKVSEAGGGANMTVVIDANVGIARVNGESVSNQGPYFVAPHSADITLDVATANATNPRIDTVVLHVRDNTHDASGSNDARVRILSGTATSGATLDNRTGAAALPSNAILLADVLVPAADTTISNAQIRDRRAWARGAYRRIVRNANAAAGVDYTTVSTSAVLIDSTNLQPRIECSGNLLKLTLSGSLTNTGASGSIVLAPAIDGTTDTTKERQQDVTTASVNEVVAVTWNLVPAAGSHLIAPAWWAPSGTARFLARSTHDVELVIEEIVRPDASNG